MKKRILPLILVLTLIFTTTISVSAIATSEPLSADNLQIEQTVTNYLNAYLREAYLYEDTNLATYSVTTQQLSRSTGRLTVYGKAVTVSEAAENTAYMERKANYFKATRQAQGIYRTDFNVEYTLNSTKISKTSATVNVSAIMSFKYSDHDDLSILEEVFNIALVKIDGAWLVADAVEASGWFDATYKNNTSFDLEQFTQESVEILRKESEIVEVSVSPESISSPKTEDSAVPLATETSLSYDRNNAVAYAYTYTTSTTNTPTTYYNGNFQYFSADCMNFVSQCILGRFRWKQ